MKKVLILGSGISGIGVAKLLRKQQFECLLSDINPIAREKIISLEQLGVQVYSGVQTKELLDDIDLIVPSPGIPLSVPILQQAQSLAIPIQSDVQIARQFFSGDIIGVTGTNGKSTTVELIAHLLNKQNIRAVAVGNVGISPCELLASQPQPQVLVMELSSYQLESCDHMDVKVSVFTSFAPDHLARHGTMDNYFQAKWKLYSQTQEGGSIIFSPSFLSFLKTHPQSERGDLQVYVVGRCRQHESHSRYRFVDTTATSVKIDDTPYQLPPWGLHNRTNAIFAVISCLKLGIKLPFDLRPVLQDFHFLPFRFQIIGKLSGCSIVNDSKATNVEATRVAMESMDDNFYLLLGGQGKGESFTSLNHLKQGVLKAFCFGESALEIYQQIDFAHKSYHDTLELAVNALIQEFSLHPGPILFSPACASFDEFKNFEHRGHVFNLLMSKLPEFQSWSAPPPIAT